MVLSENRNVDRFVDQELRSFPVAAGTRVFRGAFVGMNDNGFARPLQAGDAFLGIAYEEMDNTIGSSGDKQVRVFTQGDFELNLNGVVQADVGRAVYTSSDDTLTVVVDGNSPVGRIIGITSTNRIVLRIDTFNTTQERISHHSSNVVLRQSDAGRVHTNLGAAGVITCVLPSSAPAGSTYRFVCMEDQALRIKPGNNSSIYIKGSKQANGKYVGINDIGDFIHLIADGYNDWVAFTSISGADADISVES